MENKSIIEMAKEYSTKKANIAKLHGQYDADIINKLMQQLLRQGEQFAKSIVEINHVCDKAQEAGNGYVARNFGDKIKAIIEGTANGT